MADKLDEEDNNGGGGDEACCARPQESSASEEERNSAEGGVDDNVTLSFLDKLKCMMYSKVERDAFLIEKLEKEEKKKAKKAGKGSPGDPKEPTAKKKNLFDKLKSVFSTPEEQQKFLEEQVEEIESKNRQSQSEGEGAAIASGETVAKSP